MLLEGKLRPGTPLRERQLAEIFGLTRGAVRKVLGRLGQEGKVQAFTNRGSFVPQPTIVDVQQVYDARKAVESGIVAVLTSRMTTSQLARLRMQVQKNGGRSARGCATNRSARGGIPYRARASARQRRIDRDSAPADLADADVCSSFRACAPIRLRSG